MFIDNIAPSLEAGFRVSTLLGRMPSAVGYQPNPGATEDGQKHQNITSHLYFRTGSLRRTTLLTLLLLQLFFLDVTSTVNSRYVTELGIYPAVDPASSSSALSPSLTTVQALPRYGSSGSPCGSTPRPLGHHCTNTGMDELRSSSAQTSRRKIQQFLSQSFHVPKFVRVVLHR